MLLHSRPCSAALLTFVLACLALAPADAAVFTVGSDAACTHSSVLAAVAAAAINGPGLDEIRIATNQAHTAVVAPVVSHNLLMRGGYASCSASTTSGRTLLLGGTSNVGGIISTSGTDAAYNLRLENIELRGAVGGPGRRGGGLSLEGNYSVLLINVAVNGNRAGRGGGIYIDGSEGLELVLAGGTVIAGNTASISGGGIFCQQGGSILATADGGSLLENVAEDGGTDPNESGNGGGVALYEGCGMYLRGQGQVGFNGVLLNRAARDGGGLYLRGGAELQLQGNAGGPVRVTDNQAGVGGGGIAVRDPLPVTDANRSIVIIVNSWVDSNRAPFGAGLGLMAGGDVQMRRDLAGADCHDATYCSSLSLNDKRAGDLICFGAAVYADEGARLEIANTFIEENCLSNSGWAIRQRLNSQLRIDSSVIARNGGAQPFFIDGSGATTAGVQGFTGLQQIAWSTISGHYESTEAAMFLLPSMSSASNGTLRVYGSVLGERFANLTQVGGPGAPPPMTLDFDCLLLDTTAGGIVPSLRSVQTNAPYGMLNPASGDYAPASGSADMVDLCDTSRGARGNGDILGRTAVGDAPRANRFGIHDAGAFEFPAAAVLIFANGFEGP